MIITNCDKVEGNWKFSLHLSEYVNEIYIHIQRLQIWVVYVWHSLSKFCCNRKDWFSILWQTVRMNHLRMILLATDVDASGNVVSFIEMSGEALKFHKPGQMPQCLCCANKFHCFFLDFLYSPTLVSVGIHCIVKCGRWG